MENNENKKGSSEQSDSSQQSDFDKELDEFFEIEKELNTSIGNTIWTTNGHSSGNAFGLSTGTGNNSLVSWATLGSMNDHTDFNDIFIKITAHLSEDDVSKMLSEIKTHNQIMYKLCLVNLISFPNFRLMSEKFLIDTFDDYKDRLDRLNFEMVYGRILDTMPGLKLLLKI